MFAKKDDGIAVCLADYNGLKNGAEIPQVNELYSVAQEWADKNGWADLPEWYGQPTPEQVYEQWKVDRQQAVDSIEVEHIGVIYQGDELSQTRMARSITALPDDVTVVPWTAKDNTVHGLTRSDLRAILFDAGMQQALIWNDGRPQASS